MGSGARKRVDETWLLPSEARTRALPQYLFAAAQVLVGLVDPVGPRWIEHIQVHGVRQGLSLVRHVRGNSQHLTGVHHDFFAVNPEFQRTFQNISNLLVVMAVLGNDAAPLEEDACQHDVLPDDKLPLQQGIQVFKFHGAPGNVLESRLRSEEHTSELQSPCNLVCRLLLEKKKKT